MTNTFDAGTLMLYAILACFFAVTFVLYLGERDDHILKKLAILFVFGTCFVGSTFLAVVSKVVTSTDPVDVKVSESGEIYQVSGNYWTANFTHYKSAVQNVSVFVKDENGELSKKDLGNKEYVIIAETEGNPYYEIQSERYEIFGVPVYNKKTFVYVPSDL